MTETVAVGFSPAAVPGLSLGASSASAKPAAEGGLFAALLALVAPTVAGDLDLSKSAGNGLQSLFGQSPANAKAKVDTLVDQLSSDLGELGDLGEALKALAADKTIGLDPEALASALTRLTKALGATADTIETDGTPNEAQTKELDAAANAVLTLLNVAPALTQSDAPDTDTTGGSSGAASGAPATKPDQPDDAQPALADRLAKLLGDTADALAATSPALADKLKTLARELPALPEAVLAKLDLPAGAADDAPVPELVALVDSATRDSSNAKKPAAKSDFATPVLPAPASKTDDPDTQTDASKATANGTSKPSDASTDAPDPAIDAPRVQATQPDKADRPAPAPQATTAQSANADADAGNNGDAKSSTTAQGVAAATAPQPPAAAMRAAHVAYQSPSAPINIPQVAFEIVRQFEAGNSRFQIRLDPAELGRIDVRLDMDKSGTVNARMTVERPETLDLMQRDQRALQQALQQAGLDPNRTNLEFSLRQNPFAGDGFANSHQNGRSGQQGGGEPALADLGAEPIPEIYRGTASSSALNLFV